MKAGEVDLSTLILLRTNPILGARCAATGGVLIRNRPRTGTTIVLLPLFLVLRLRFPAGAPRESAGELALNRYCKSHGSHSLERSSSQPVLHNRWVERPSAKTGLGCWALRSASWSACSTLADNVPHCLPVPTSKTGSRYPHP